MRRIICIFPYIPVDYAGSFYQSPRRVKNRLQTAHKMIKENGLMIFMKVFCVYTMTLIRKWTSISVFLADMLRRCHYRKRYPLVSDEEAF